LVHVTEDFIPSGGGQPAVIADHLAWQVRLGWDVALLHTAAARALMVPGARLTSCPPVWPGQAWRWSPGLQSSLKVLLSRHVDVVHLHGIWTAPQAVASDLARKKGIPAIISFHGQLLDAETIKKRLYMHGIGNRVVRRAQVLHAITAQERDVLMRLFPNNPIEVIPNAVDVDVIKRELTQIDLNRESEDKQILFLGRLDVRKGILPLLEAFLRADLPDTWSLCIAGPDDTPGLRARLEDAAKQAKERNKRITILGAVYGLDKWRLLTGASLVCLPSFHEVIGMVNLEAAVCGKPVLTTPYTGLEGWEEAGGMIVEPSVEQLAGALRQVALWSDSERMARGTSLGEWVSRHYSLKRVCKRWIELYEAVRA